MILVCPGRHAQAQVEAHRPSHVITLASPDADVPALDIPAGRRLIRRFHDIAEPREGLIPPDAALVAGILEFAAGWSPSEGPLLVHCFAGVSRSTAAAYAIACARTPGEETTLAQALRVASPSATPNALMVSLTDEALGRGGRMIAAIAAIGRGADCFEGEAFSLPLVTRTI